MDRYVFLTLAGISLVAGCGDPVRDALADSLGPEAPNVRPGPAHRPGQPCLACHTDGGRAQPAFAIAGTTYRERDAPNVLGHVTVTLSDADGKTLQTRSNCAGNFYLLPQEVAMREPFWVTLVFNGRSIDMESPVYREGSCAGCHSQPVAPSSAGVVFMTDDSAEGAVFGRVPCRD
jgi:hypothetical protein